MELIFNEVSFLPDFNDDYALTEHFIGMLRLYDKVRERYGFNHLVFPENISSCIVTNGKTFIEWANSISHQGIKNKVLSIPFVRPFLGEVVKEKEKELPKYYYSNHDVGIVEKYCSGLATAYLTNKLAISLNTHRCWNSFSIEFKEIYNDDLETNDIYVNNITTEAHLSEEEVDMQLMYSGKLKLDKCPINPNDKDLTLSGDHHGNHKLKKFAKKLFKNEYVVSVINNIDFSPKAINFIKNIYPDGKIELILHWESPGYGMIIKTTGNNYRETEAIAEILKREFDK